MEPGNNCESAPAEYRSGQPTHAATKMKEKVCQKPSTLSPGQDDEDGDNLSLDLKLAHYHDPKLSHLSWPSKLTLRSNQGVNILDPIEIGNSDSESRSPYKGKRVFTCNFCTRDISTSQAHGGHKNAHKKEHAVPCIRHTTTLTCLTAPSTPCNSTCNGNLGRSLSGSPLRMRAQESMIHHTANSGIPHAVNVEGGGGSMKRRGSYLRPASNSMYLQQQQPVEQHKNNEEIDLSLKL